MKWPWRKDTPLNSDEYEKLIKKIAELRGDLTEIESKVRKHYDELHSLRGKFYKNKAEESEDLNEPFGHLKP